MKTVLIEGEWNPGDPPGELRWVDSLANEQGFPNAMCGQAWLNREDVDDVLAAYARHPLVKGIRHKPTAVSREEHTDDFVAPGSMRNPEWRDGYAKLHSHELLFIASNPLAAFRRGR